jgi:hypothetical protein
MHSPRIGLTQGFVAAYMTMHNHQDYTTTIGVGIRVRAENCQVIRWIRGKWQELGPVYEIPVDRRLMLWNPPAIPPGVLAVALRTFEAEYPGTRLRYLLMMSDAQRRGMFASRVMQPGQGESAA